MISKALHVGLILSSITLPGFLLAASSDFTIRAYISNDTVPPTTPTLLSVTPVAATQVDVAWSASTDDVMVAGYRVFRDAVQIATTTLLMYSDIGLTASTTYSYTVDAFDSFANVSSSSLSLATTTLANLIPIATSTPTTSASVQSGTRLNQSVLNLVVTSTQTAATFTWQTQGQTQYMLVWGRTTSYELGSVSGIVFSQSHVTTLTNLEPGTNYYYQLRAITNRGVVTILDSNNFTTQSLVSPMMLPNVREFTATTEKNNVVLAWNNNFATPNFFVRVVRSHLFYPSTVQSGAVVYEGRGQAFIDKDALAGRSPQYYTIFVLDGTGAVSSGAVARVYRDSTQPDTASLATTTSNARTTFPDTDSGEDRVLKANDINVIQQTHNQLFDDIGTLEPTDSYLVRIPFAALPKNLKSIIVSVQNPGDQRVVSAYLLKLNQAGDAYEAYITGPGIVGDARIMIEVFDYEQATVRRISRTVSFKSTTPSSPFFPDQLLVSSPYIMGGFIGTSFIFWLLFLLKHRRRQE